MMGWSRCNNLAVRSKYLLWPVLTLGWMAGLGAGWCLLLDHSYRPGKATAAIPPNIAIEPASNYRVLLFAHPLCPCTRASIQELFETLHRTSPNIEARIVFVTADLDPSSAHRSALVNLAKQNSNVEIDFDTSGSIVRRYGAAVSGEVFAFNPQGLLIFHGGLTPSRGHEGDGLGQRGLEQLLNGQSKQYCASPVYGCRLPIKK